MFRFYLKAYKRLASWEKGKRLFMIYGPISVWIYGVILPSLVFFPLSNLVVTSLDLGAFWFFALWLIPIALICSYLFKAR